MPYKRQGKRQKRNRKYSAVVIPESNLVDFVKESKKRGNLHQCPFCDIYSSNDEDYLAIHIQHHHQEQLSMVLKLLGREQREATTTEG